MLDFSGHQCFYAVKYRFGAFVANVKGGESVGAVVKEEFGFHISTILRLQLTDDVISPVGLQKLARIFLTGTNIFEVAQSL